MRDLRVSLCIVCDVRWCFFLLRWVLMDGGQTKDLCVPRTLQRKQNYLRLLMGWNCNESIDCWRVTIRDSSCIHWTLSTWAPSQHWTLGHIGRHLHRQIRPNVLWPFTSYCLVLMLLDNEGLSLFNMSILTSSWLGDIHMLRVTAQLSLSTDYCHWRIKAEQTKYLRSQSDNGSLFWFHCNQSVPL